MYSSSDFKILIIQFLLICREEENMLYFYKMKITPFIIFFYLLFSFSAKAQSNYEYSFGLKILSVEEFPKILNEVKGKSKYYLEPTKGLIFKANDNQISYRFQVYTYNNKNFSFKNECETCEIITGKYKSLDIKLGFERSVIYSKLQPFYGLDLGFKKVNFEGTSKDANNNAFLYNANVEKNGGLVYPFVGLKFNIIPVLSLSIESGIDFYYSDDKEVKSGQTNSLYSLNHYRRWEFATRPIGLLSLEYNFGRN
jgi:hypothetical protein